MKLHRDLINQARREAGLTQKELAKRLGGGQSMVSSALSRDDIYLSTLVRMLDAAGYKLTITPKEGANHEKDNA